MHYLNCKSLTQDTENECYYIQLGTLSLNNLYISRELHINGLIEYILSVSHLKLVHSSVLTMISL